MYIFFRLKKKKNQNQIRNKLLRKKKKRKTVNKRKRRKMFVTLKVFFLLSGTEISLERRVKETPVGESTAGPWRCLLIQSLVVGSSLRIWTSSTVTRDHPETNISNWIFFLFPSIFVDTTRFIDCSDASAKELLSV